MATPKTAPAVQTAFIPGESTKRDYEELISRKMEPVPVTSTSEVKYFQELGLGRGIDTSDPQMWKNKISMQIRLVNDDLSNIIATDESGIIHKYEKVVSSLKTQQAKIQTSLSDPSLNIKIGLDAHYSQSASSTVTIKGTKVLTRTISFQHQFDDLPVDSDMAEMYLKSKMFSQSKSGYSTFEHRLATWLLGELQDSQKHRAVPAEPDIGKLKGKTALEKLATYEKSIQGVDSPAQVALTEHCRTFVFEFGITHYVSSIQLGAVKYSTESRQTQKTDKGISGNVGVGSEAYASPSTDVVAESSQSSNQENDIGYFNEDGMVRRDTTDESVIGFELQPISNLIRLPEVKTAMITAIELYLLSKTDNTGKNVSLSISMC